MAVTVTQIDSTRSSNTKVFDVTATADADTTADITHNLFTAAEIAAGVDVDTDDIDVSIEPLLGAAHTSQWYIASRDQGGTKTVVRLTKGTGVGSGNAGAQIRVKVSRRHSLMR